MALGPAEYRTIEHLADENESLRIQLTAAKNALAAAQPLVKFRAFQGEPTAATVLGMIDDVLNTK